MSHNLTYERGELVMGRPGRIEDVYIPNALMSRVALEYPAQEFISLVACPSLKVVKKSDKYYKFKKSHLNKVDDETSPGSAPRRIIWEIDSTPTYVCNYHKLESTLPDELKENTDPPINADKRTTEDLLRVHLLGHASRVQALFYTKYAGGQAVSGNQWDDTGGACTTIEDDIDAAIENVKTNFGTPPNTIIMNDQTYTHLKKNATLRTLWKYVTGSIGEVLDVRKMFAAMFDLKNFLVAGAMYNSANKGATEVLSRLWGKNAYLAYIEPSPALMSPTFCCNINTELRKISNYREPRIDSTIFRIDSTQVEKVISSEACRCIKDVIA